MRKLWAAAAGRAAALELAMGLWFGHVPRVVVALSIAAQADAAATAGLWWLVRVLSCMCLLGLNEQLDLSKGVRSGIQLAALESWRFI
jgi:hypothetical protein